jgi:hypothetical protein
MKIMFLNKIYWGGSIFVLLLTIFSCTEEAKNLSDAQKMAAANPVFLHRSLDALSENIKHDVFPPMIAARIYAYANIAAWEATSAGNSQLNSMTGQIKDLPNMPTPPKDGEICFPLAAVKAHLKVGKVLTFSEDSMTKYTDAILNEYKKIGIPKAIFERSIAFGDTVAGAVLAWSKKDNYAQTRSMPKFSVNFQDAARWRPTSPDYADAFEPHWNKMRTLTLDSAAQYLLPRPPKFDSTANSPFYKLAKEAYDINVAAKAEDIETAKYWDDSPASTQNAGHVNFMLKKITPGGHWLHIAQWAARQRGFNFEQSTEAYLLATLAVFDGFIACWDEKYRSTVIRPESYINKYIAKQQEFTPVIVTPPFPEYPSGHSTVSGASAVVLTKLFGENFAFRDSTEVQFGLGSRNFSSFREAAQQAMQSRLLGGIHYRSGNEAGFVLGEKIGNHVLTKIKTRK